jgi:carbonic anhydrase
VDELRKGYRRFRNAGWPAQQRLFESLAETGQRPRALVISCVDSRVDPAVIFDAAPGDLLTVRNVANLVPPYAPDVANHGTSAAVEFAVQVLAVPRILVLGHEFCGGVQVLLEGAPPHASDFVGPWMSIADGARQRADTCALPEERRRVAEQEVIKVSLANLMSFPWLAQAVSGRKLVLHGAWFSIRTGDLAWLRPDGSFSADAL